MNGTAGQVREALNDLVKRGILRPDQVDPVATAVDAALRARSAAPDRAARWGEIVSYAGGALVLAGGTVLVATAWTDLSRGTRIGLLAVVTVLLLAVAIWAGWGSRPLTALTTTAPPTTGPVRRRVAGVTWTLASGTAALGAGQLPGEYELLVGALAGLVVAALGYLRVPSAPGLLAIGVFSVPLLHEALGLRGDPPDLLMALVTIALGGLFAALAATGALPHRTLAVGIGAAIALLGGQWPFFDHPAWGYSLTFLVGVGCLALYALERTWVLIVAGVIGISVAVPEAVWDLTDGSVGGALITVIAGFVLLGAGGVGIAWHRRTTERAHGGDGREQ